MYFAYFSSRSHKRSVFCNFYPASSVVPFSDFIQAVEGGEPQVSLTCHQHCGAATYIFIDDDNKVQRFRN